MKGIGTVGLAGLLLAACASAPKPAAQQPIEPLRLAVDAGVTAPLLGQVDLRFDGSPPRPGTADPLLTSNLRIGTDGPLSYESRYAVTPGDAFSAIGTEIMQAPSRLGGQQLDQQVTLRSPSIAGAPIAIGLSSEMLRHWSTSGGYSHRQQERAQLRWSPSLFELQLMWTDTAVPVEEPLALNCQTQATLQVPLFQGMSRGGQSIRVHGRDCSVRLSGVEMDAAGVHQWGMAYAWSRAWAGLTREGELSVSRIDPVQTRSTGSAVAEPGWELGLRHQIEFGTWQARARVAHHRIGDTPLGAWSQPLPEHGYRDGDDLWSTEAALRRTLPAFSVAAVWAGGIDPLWFVPAHGHRRDRFGLELDFSAKARRLLPDSTPTLTMRWDWTQARQADDSLERDNRVALDLAIHW